MPGSQYSTEQQIAAQQREEFRLRELQRQADEHADEQPKVAAAPVQEVAAAPAVREPEPEIRHEPQDVEAPRVEAPRVEAPRMKAPRYEAPKVDPKELLSSAGLQMVETDRSKAQQVAAEPEEGKLGRPRRERTKPSAEETELLQVETRNK